LTEIFATVFVASLLGSMHCIGMCGGFVAFYAGNEGTRSPQIGAHVAYNLGRLATYVALGLFAGALGAAVNLAGGVSGVRDVAAMVAGALIVAWGGALLLQASGVRWAKMPAPQWLNRLLSKVLPRLIEKPPVVRGLVLGMASTLLPCGWLYGFAVTAAGTGSAALGAAVMAAFWLGTVPAMLGVGLGIQKLARLVGPRLGVVMPAMLVLMGIFTLANRGFAFGPMAPGAHGGSAADVAAESPHDGH
jgi:hypothetical protein